MDSTVDLAKRQVSDLVRVATCYYGDLNAGIEDAMTAQQLVDGLRVARRGLQTSQLAAVSGTPAHERFTNRIRYISDFINQVKATFEGEVQ
ncbi:hypothetical protein D3C73_17130 [compost metagenome]